jgi:hypothetical protein
MNKTVLAEYKKMTQFFKEVDKGESKGMAEVGREVLGLL